MVLKNVTDIINAPYQGKGVTQLNWNGNTFKAINHKIIKSMTSLELLDLSKNLKKSCIKEEVLTYGTLFHFKKVKILFYCPFRYSVVDENLANSMIFICKEGE